MGYLNNTTRILDAILTKKGREILSTGGDFNVSKFALGDDEVDYGLWDITHTKGTDYYGAVIDNLPALEPFNDPSEIMKYKLVTRSEGTRAMAKLQDIGSTSTNLGNLEWRPNDTTQRTAIAALTNTQVGYGKSFGVMHIINSDVGAVDYNVYSGETYTVTLLDSSVAVLAPSFVNVDVGDSDRIIQTHGTNSPAQSDLLWIPFVNSVQHFSQTISGVQLDGNSFKFDNGPNGQVRGLYIYSKRISSTAKTSILITGEQSGATMEFDVTVTYNTTIGGGASGN